MWSSQSCDARSTVKIRPQKNTSVPFLLTKTWLPPKTLTSTWNSDWTYLIKKKILVVAGLQVGDHPFIKMVVRWSHHTHCIKRMDHIIGQDRATIEPMIKGKQIYWAEQQLRLLSQKMCNSSCHPKIESTTCQTKCPIKRRTIVRKPKNHINVQWLPSQGLPQHASPTNNRKMQDAKREAMRLRQSSTAQTRTLFAIVFWDKRSIRPPHTSRVLVSSLLWWGRYSSSRIFKASWD